MGGNRKRKTSILIVEDNPKWLSALQQMYTNILSKDHVNIMPINQGRKALELLENGNKFDLISLDINLGSTHPKDCDSGKPNIDQLGADGRSVLRLAHKKRACNGLMLITGMHADSELQFVWPDGHREWAALTLYLKTLFPGMRSHYLPKNEKLTPDANVAEYESALTKQILQAMTQPQPVTIRCKEADSYAPKIEIQQSLKQEVFDGDPVARFIYELAVARNRNDFLSHMNVEEFKGEIKTATIFVDGVTRSLKRRGFNPDGIYKKIRGRGWQFVAGVETRGFPRPSHFEMRTTQYDENRDFNMDSEFDPYNGYD